MLRVHYAAFGVLVRATFGGAQALERVWGRLMPRSAGTFTTRRKKQHRSRKRAAGSERALVKTDCLRRSRDGD